MGCHALLHGIFPTQRSNPGLPHCRWILYCLSHLQFTSDSLWPYELQHARPPCPSPTPGVHSDSGPSSQWCHPAISSSVVPFSSCPQSLATHLKIFLWGGSHLKIANMCMGRWFFQLNSKSGTSSIFWIFCADSTYTNECSGGCANFSKWKNASCGFVVTAGMCCFLEKTVMKFQGCSKCVSKCTESF